MAVTRALPPIEQLFQMAIRSRRNAYQLPQQIEIKETWDGIGFRLGSHQLVAPMEQIKEILDYPSLARVPGAHLWVKGLANIRGNLLPILDPAALLLATPSQPHRESRIFVIEHQGVTAGLMIDELLGMRHFVKEEHRSKDAAVNSGLKPFLTGQFRQRGADWWVFDFHRLAEDPLFMQVTA